MQKWVKKTKDFSPHCFGCGSGISSCFLQSTLYNSFICFAKSFGQPLKTCHRQLFPPSPSLFSNPTPLFSQNKKYSNQTATVFLMVAGRGFEPPDLWVMSPTSYLTAPPRDILLYNNIKKQALCQLFFAHT